MVRPVVSKEDVVEAFVRASGPGGQNVNKVATCVQLVHKPTGIVVKCQKNRTQYLNRQEAWHMLQAAVEKKYAKELQELKQAKEKKRRQNRKRSAGAKERMLEVKKKHALKKKQRRGVASYE